MSSRSPSGRSRRRLRLSRRATALSVTVLGALLLVAGVAVRVGIGESLICAGVLAIAGGLLLVDVDEDRRRGR